jgi:hypothetical protein
VYFRSIFGLSYDSATCPNVAIYNFENQLEKVW